MGLKVFELLCFPRSLVRMTALSFCLRHSIEHLLRAQLPTSLPRRCPPRSLTSHPPLRSDRNHANVVSSCYPDRTPTAFEAAEVAPISGVEEALMGLITGKRKAVEVVHSIWKKIVKKGDVVIDATCGNGHDTLTLVRLVADGSNSGSGIVYGLDIQKSALESTSNLLDQFASEKEKGAAILFHLCHSKMEDVVSKDASVRLVAFNLGYLPGGDKSIITLSRSTLLALQAASRLLKSGGIISLVVYVGHPGGREEFETVQSFASSLPADCWVSCKFEVLNKPMAPIIVLLFKK